MNPFLDAAIEGARRAGEIHRRYFRQQPEIRKKGRIDLVTAADTESEQMFRDLVAARFPDHVVLGEETGIDPQASSRFRWIIDPVDGTTNFAHGLALFCVSIALEVGGELEVGVVFDPIADELFTATRGGGAQLNGAALAVTDCATMVDAMLVTGFPYTVREHRRDQVALFAAFLEEAQAVRRLGSAALDLAYLAAGRFDGFWEERLRPWDIAAGVLIVREAGGLVTGLRGERLDLFTGNITASNGALHPEMLRVVEGALRERAT